MITIRLEKEDFHLAINLSGLGVGSLMLALSSLVFLWRETGRTRLIPARVIEKKKTQLATSAATNHAHPDTVSPTFIEVTMLVCEDELGGRHVFYGGAFEIGDVCSIVSREQQHLVFSWWSFWIETLPEAQRQATA